MQEGDWVEWVRIHSQGTRVNQDKKRGLGHCSKRICYRYVFCVYRAIATIGAATVFTVICGSSVATSVTFASVGVPEMDKYHHDGDFLFTSSSLFGPDEEMP